MKRKKPVKAPELTPDQEKVLHVMMHGENVFLSGRAGTGKSFVLSRYLETIRPEKRNVLVTAPTGVAAINLRDGHTMHKEFNIPVGSFLDPDRSAAAGITPSLRIADTIIIDEISMCRRDVFDYVMKRVAYLNQNMTEHSPKQIIAVGDFFQLPPVVKNEEREILRKKYPDFGDKGFCFRSPYWRSLGFVTCDLTDVIRQKNDVRFIDMLAKIRAGDRSCLDDFNQKVVSAEQFDQSAIQLVSTNQKAVAINAACLKRIDQPQFEYHAGISGEIPKSEYPADVDLVLKKGARVISLANDTGDMLYANGSAGTVLDLDEDEVLVQFDSGVVSTIRTHAWEKTETAVAGDRIVSRTCGSFVQIPLRLAWAVTIHRSQGKTFDKVIIDPSCFESGQLYVALSRCRTLDGIQLMHRIQPRDLINADEVLAFYKDAQIDLKCISDDPDRENGKGTAPSEDSPADDEKTMISVPKKYADQVYRFVEGLDQAGKKH